jgi:hypothetical protein
MCAETSIGKQVPNNNIRVLGIHLFMFLKKRNLFLCQCHNVGSHDLQVITFDPEGVRV